MCLAAWAQNLGWLTMCGMELRVDPYTDWSFPARNPGERFSESVASKRRLRRCCHAGIALSMEILVGPREWVCVAGCIRGAPHIGARYANRTQSSASESWNQGRAMEAQCLPRWSQRACGVSPHSSSEGTLTGGEPARGSRRSKKLETDSCRPSCKGGTGAGTEF
jgi:hypothetical protein